MTRKFSFSKKELEDFRKNGYAGPFDLYDSDDMVDIYRELRAEMFDREFAAYDLPNESLLAGYDRYLDIDFLSQHIMQRKIVDKVADILGPDVNCWRSEMFPKYPGDEGTDWHQADTYGHASGKAQIEWPMGSEFGGAITVWTAITDADEENGCLRFIPGTQEEMFYDESKEMKYTPDQVNKQEVNGEKRGFFGYDYRNLQKDPDWVPDESEAVSMILKKGQFVIFWSTLMHASFPNSTKDRTRLGFTARYLPTSVKVYPGMEKIEEYGSIIDVNNHGVVLVSGKDDYGHNHTITHNRRGTKFEEV